MPIAPSFHADHAAGRWILTFTCVDRVGIVAAVAGGLSRHDGFILDSQQYADVTSGRFFMRVVFGAGGAAFPAGRDAVTAVVAAIAEPLELDWTLARGDDRPLVLIAVSKGSHCLNDLLHRRRTGMLPIDIVGIVSNHETMRSLAEWHHVPFHHLPVAEDRAAQEDRLRALVRDTGAEFLVLARYMQVLSDRFVSAHAGRIINIHHSFLPGFKGARPYERAYERGVKLIGATAHFVTADLDEGPIIEQAVERVDHRSDAADFARIGRDIETQVLARAVAWVAERRVLLNGNRTVVFR